MEFYTQFLNKKITIETVKSGSTTSFYSGQLISINSNFLEIKHISYPKNIFINAEYIVSIKEV